MIDWRAHRRQFKRAYVNMLREQGKPEVIAGGVALGTFFGFVVPPGIQMIVSIGFAPILRVNPVAAALGTWISNPLTMPFIYPLAMTLGAYITGYSIRDNFPLDEPGFWAFMTSLPAHSRIIFVMTVGLSAIGGGASFIMYYVTKGLVIEYRLKREARRKRRLKRKKAREQHGHPDDPNPN